MESIAAKGRGNDPPSWTEGDLAPWRRIEARPFEPEQQVSPIVRRLARDRSLMLEAARGAAALGLLAPLFATPRPAAAALPVDPLDWPAVPFLGLYATLVTATVLGAVLLRRGLRGLGQARPVTNLDVLELAYLGGGHLRLLDTLAVGMLVAGTAALNGGRRVSVTDGAVRLPPEQHAFRAFPARAATQWHFKKRAFVESTRIRRRLGALGLVPTGRQRRSLALLTAALVAPVLALGFARMQVDAKDGEPVGYAVLVSLWLVTGLAGLVFLLHLPDSNLAGEKTFAEQRKRHEGILFAPRDSELVLASALSGWVALVGTPWEAYWSYERQQIDNLHLALSGSSGNGGSG